VRPMSRPVLRSIGEFEPQIGSSLPMEALSMRRECQSHDPYAGPRKAPSGSAGPTGWSTNPAEAGTTRLPEESLAVDPCWRRGSAEMNSGPRRSAGEMVEMSPGKFASNSTIRASNQSAL